MKTVKMLSNYCPYVKGDICGLDDSLADKYIDVGLAEEHIEPSKEVDEVVNNIGKGQKLSKDK